MVYAIITKKTVRLENVSRNLRLKQKLGRELLPEEMKYTGNEIIRYVCVLRPKMADYEIRHTRDKRIAIFYTERELPYVEYRLKGKEYFVIDANTSPAEKPKRISAAINIAFSEAETIADVKSIA